MGILITRQKMWQRFLVPATLIVALTEAMPQGKVFYVPSRPFYFKGKRCDNVKWSNDEILAEMGRPLNPPCGYPGRPVATETNERKRRSADPEPQSYGGKGRWYTKGQLGENVRWSNDQQLIDKGRAPNSPGWIIEYMNNNGQEERQER